MVGNSEDEDWGTNGITPEVGGVIREKFPGPGIVENVISGSFGWGRRSSCSGVNSTNPTVGGNLAFSENRDSFGRLTPKIVWIITEVKSAIHMG